VICTRDDIAIGFGPPQNGNGILQTLRAAKERGAMTIAWPGRDTDYAVTAPSADAHIHQELFELLGHTMYESVHVFLEHDDVTLSLSKGDSDPSLADFLYPFLDTEKGASDGLVDDVASSIVAKSRDANALRERVAEEQSENIAAAAAAIRERLDRGGRIIAFGNGGSATDATDFALDCIMPGNGRRAIPALSLALEPAVITATANDVGTDVIFLRQLIAQCGPNDVAMAFSTSGGSRNVLAAMEEARKRRLLTVALLGYDGGEIVRRNLADAAIVVPCDYVPRIQEAQGSIYHVLRDGIAC
jgi:D-sedoheptulose 7-phosphate isomerase